MPQPAPLSTAAHRDPPSRPDADADADLAAHAAVVAQLRRPGGCPDTGDASGLIETHLSSLLLSGSQVYKLKKPVRLDFVDFSTLAARRTACEQELRLNRRTAPRWYMGLVAVRRCADGARITPPGDLISGAPVIDWAVHMRRFDDSQRADRLAQQGRLDGPMVDQLAAVVTRFQACQSPAPPGFGRSETTRHWARANLVELAALAPDPGSRATVTALQRWTETAGAALAGLMDLRRRTGHVRELHGDLHLANVFWADGVPVLFDALEFNDTLRHIDTIGDLAFPFMDLLAHGLPRLAWRFIGTALDASGDWAALPLLRWWAAYRAAVRAKVAWLDAAGSTDAVRRQGLDAQARRYLAVAAALAGAAVRPALLHLVLTFGLAGAGKSTVAGALAERLGGVRLRSDVERKRLFALPPTARSVPGLYGAEATRLTYERLQELADLALAAGVPVVVDAASLRRSERDALRAVAARRGALFTLLACVAPADVLRARVRQRQCADDDASDATPEVLALQQTTAEWPGPDEAGDTLRLDTDLGREALARRVDALVLGGRAEPALAGACARSLPR